jgi:hypothetical protein
MKSDISPLYLTYFMVRWEEVEQAESDQKCTDCGHPLMKTEVVTSDKGGSFEGYVCHSDKRVTWVRTG